MQVANRVRENTTTTGTGPVTVGGAPSSQYRTFASANLTHSFPYYINDSNGNWEEGRGTFSSGTVTRAIVEDSSAGPGKPISLSGTAVIGIDLNAGAVNDLLGEPSAVPPNAFPNLVLWLDAANATPSQWTDTSGQGNHATQATAANQPTITSSAINGLPAVSFNGSSQYYNSPYLGEPATVLIVYKIAPNTTGYYALMGGNTSENTATAAYYMQALNNPSSGVMRRSFCRLTAQDQTIGGAWRVNASPVTGAWNIFGAINDGSSLSLYNNSHLCGSPVQKPNCPTLPISAAVVGADFWANAVTHYFNGEIAEIIVYSSALTPQQFSQVESWLEQKYAMQDQLDDFLYACFEANGSNDNLVLLTGNDGINWTYRPSNFVPITHSYTAGYVRDPSIAFIQGALWLIYTSGTTTFTLAVCTDGFNFNVVQYLDCSNITTNGGIWAPEFFVDSDQSVHITVTISATASSDTGFQVYEMHPIDTYNLYGAWTQPAAISGTSLPTNLIDSFMTKLGGTYNLWCKDETNKEFVLLTSTSLTSGYVVTGGDNFQGAGTGVEAPCCFNTGGENWVLLSDHQGSGIYYQTISTVALSDTAFPATGWSAPATVNAPFTPQHGTVIRTPKAFFNQG